MLLKDSFITNLYRIIQNMKPELKICKRDGCTENKIDKSVLAAMSPGLPEGVERTGRNKRRYHRSPDRSRPYDREQDRSRNSSLDKNRYVFEIPTSLNRLDKIFCNSDYTDKDQYLLVSYNFVERKMQCTEIRIDLCR